MSGLQVDQNVKELQATVKRHRENILEEVKTYKADMENKVRCWILTPLAVEKKQTVLAVAARRSPLAARRRLQPLLPRKDAPLLQDQYGPLVLDDSRGGRQRRSDPWVPACSTDSRHTVAKHRLGTT